MILSRIFIFIRSIKNIFLFFILFLFLLSILSNIISPNTCRYIAPFGLFFIPLFLAVVVICGLYFRRNKLIAGSSLGLLFFAIQYLPNTFGLPKTQELGPVKVMTWNVKNFDLYNWSKNKETRQRMLQEIDSVSPDILCIQEFFTNDFEHNNVESIQRMGYKYHSFIPSYTQSSTGNKWGLAIFSKYAISNEKFLQINEKPESMNQCLRADIKVKGKLYHVYNAHFQSIHFDYKDYDYIQDVKHEWKMLDYFKSYEIIFKVLKAYTKRANQIEKLDGFMPKDNVKNTILCCDLNDVPNSFAYQQLTSKFVDGFKVKGSYFSNTTSMPIPIFRIDYVFTSNDLKISSHSRTKTTLSDHNYIVSTLE